MLAQTSLPRKKLVIIGDGCTGKTALLMTYALRQFPEQYVPTIFENYTVTTSYKPGKRIELSMWDTAGQEDYDRLRPLSYPDADVLVICFTLAGDSKDSYYNVLQKWYPETRHFCPGVPLVLIGTKADLRENPKKPQKCIVTTKEGQDLASKIRAAAYLEISSKTASIDELDHVFSQIALVLMSRRRRGHPLRVASSSIQRNKEHCCIM
ncbi:hypothetical protein HMI54_004995 [Coelomomyces lativittatus]|nr:hypothetical protein HMI54_004995 [Coelomomyces lativittatus]KAJ1510329.1 hypothetical protein HMI55_007039 [Coelomomyces lativittatus]KAJ1512460.1 hypothetical protein HMI56_004037 [Coelomomyces lativittatus]